MNKITLRDRSGQTVFACLAPSLRHAVQLAVSSHINLDNIALAGFDLRGANLDGASFRGADLRGCDLTAANLAEADLHDADLTNARLVDACLCEANLTCTDFSGSCWGATLVYDAKMQGTILPLSALQNIDWQHVDVCWPVYVSCESVWRLALHAEPLLLRGQQGWQIVTADGVIIPQNTTIDSNLWQSISHQHYRGVDKNTALHQAG